MSWKHAGAVGRPPTRWDDVHTFYAQRQTRIDTDDWWHLVDLHEWSGHFCGFAIAAFKMVKMEIPQYLMATEKTEPVVAATKKEKIETKPTEFFYLRDCACPGVSLAMRGDCMNIVKWVKSLKRDRFHTRISWAQRVLFHLFRKFNWMPPNKSAMGFLEHVYREDNRGADRLATEGRKNGGESLVCNWFDLDIKHIVCQWDGGFDPKTERGGGFIVAGAMAENVVIKPMIEWSLWIL